jgi:hypothetical protein
MQPLALAALPAFTAARALLRHRSGKLMAIFPGHPAIGKTPCRPRAPRVDADLGARGLGLNHPVYLCHATAAPPFATLDRGLATAVTPSLVSRRTLSEGRAAEQCVAFRMLSTAERAHRVVDQGNPES